MSYARITPSINYLQREPSTRVGKKWHHIRRRLYFNVVMMCLMSHTVSYERREDLEKDLFSPFPKC